MRAAEFLLLPALLLTLTGCGSSRILDDLRAGRAQGTWIEGVPFERQKPGQCGPAALSSLVRHWGKEASQASIARETMAPGDSGALGFALWRYARRAGLAAVQAPGLEPGTLDALLAQKAPVLLNLSDGKTQHYVLVTGHDRSRGAWIMHDGVRADRVVLDRWLMPRWEATGRWALVAVPPTLKLAGLGLLHLPLADRVEELGGIPQALAHVDAALAAKPEEATAWYRKGRLQRALGLPFEAEKAYRESIRLDPETPDAYNNLAALLSENPTRMPEAEAMARSAVSLCKKDARTALRLPYVLDTLGLILRKQNREDEARIAFEAALQAAAPGSPVADEIQAHLAAQLSPR